jgi:endonuclease/exonuclease/phosphatase family metal-dependent hydrolase
MDTILLRRSARIILSASLLAALVAVPAGCAGKNRSARKSGPVRAAAANPITIDGDFGDWPREGATIADANWVYFRVAVEGQSMPLQASPESLSLWLDADANPNTGVTLLSPNAASGLGIDLMVQYSSPDAKNPGRGATVFAVDNQGNRTPLTFEQAGLASAPTFAANAFEVRISRHIDPAIAPGLAAAVNSGGRGCGMFVLSDATGKYVGWSDPETFTKPAAAAARTLFEEAIPAKQPGCIRVVSYNVLKSKLMTQPNSFARLFQVLDADVILVQEWDADAATATSWFTAVVTGQHAWNARAAAGDVVIVSPHPLAPLGPDTLTMGGSPGSEEPDVRFVGAIITTPAGDIAAGSMHLKCCGTAGSSEDIKRISQAGTINSAMQTALGGGTPKVRVFGGDLNLVGSRTPLETLCSGLDADSSALVPAMPIVLGDTSTMTWLDDPSGFPPGRLDYVTYSDSSAEVVNAFVLDTRLLSIQSLARVGLDSADSAGSDHLPVVVDIRPR